MKILILTIGLRGNVQPCVALGQGLQQAGHAVTQMVNTPAMQQNVAAVGARIRAEDGTANAIHFAEGIAAGRQTELS